MPELQRTLHRSVTDSRRLRSGRPRVSRSGRRSAALIGARRRDQSPLARLAGTALPELLEGVDAGAVAVAPAEPHRVPADQADVVGPDVGADGPGVQRPLSGQLVHAAGAGAGLPELLVRVDAPVAIGPRDVNLAPVHPADLDRTAVHASHLDDTIVHWGTG